jgi:hypothetical protein
MDAETMPTQLFQKGHDPRRNMKGRGKGEINLTDLVRRIGMERVSREDKMTRIEAVVRATYRRAFDGDMKAVDIITERGWGKVTQPIENTGNQPLVTIIQEAHAAST